MASHSVNIVRVEGVFPIEGADRIEAVQIGGYQSIVQKGQYKVGDLVAYIPEQSFVPALLLEEMGLTGKLAGAQKNRVKAIKLKGVLSQGLVYPLASVQNKRAETAQEFGVPYFGAVQEGDDVAELLGITKYEPVIPAQFAGQFSRPRGEYNLLNYDIENIKKMPKQIVPGEPVVMTEKIRGTQLQAWFWADTGEFAVTSKGLASRGYIIEDNEANANNTYIRAAKKYDLAAKISKLARALNDNMSRVLVNNTERGLEVTAVAVIGEVFGHGIQDLHYGEDLGFRVFDIYIATRECIYTATHEKSTGNVKMGEMGRYADAIELRALCDNVLALPCVPLLYCGPFSQEALMEHTNGYETVSGKSLHIREGVVVRPFVEREHCGRVILKSVSEAYLLRRAYLRRAYLLRRGGTEFN